MKPLTEKQYLTLIFIQDFTVSTGYSPLVKEIAAHFGVSSSTICERLDVLESVGYTERKKWIDHSIRVRRLPGRAA